MHVVLADWLESIDSINDTLSHPDFEATVHNPWFLLGSVAFAAVALLRGWKALLAIYVAGLVIWYVVANVVMKDKTGADGGSAILMFSGMIVVVAGFLIYFMLIKD